MKTILVPVDHSSTSENAVRFVGNWANQYGYDQIILLKISNESVFDYLHIAEGYTMFNEENINILRETAESLLKDFSVILSTIAPNVKVSTFLSRSTILRSINDSIKENPSIELITLGADFYNQNDESFISDHIVDIARTSPVRTLIVPNNYSYEKIENILVPCDIEQLEKLDRISKFQTMLQNHNLKLNLLNVYKKEDQIEKGKKDLENYININFPNNSTKVYYSQDPNIIKGIALFASENKTDLITALPGKHSFLYYFINKSVTEKIYRNVNKPVLILK